MNKFSKIEEEDEDDDEEEKLKFLQNSLQLQQFIMDDDPQPPQENDISFGVSQQKTGFQSELKEVTTNLTQSQIEKAGLRQSLIRPTSAFAVGTSKFIKSSEESAKPPAAAQILNELSSGSSHSIKTPTNPNQNNKLDKQQNEIILDRPKTANDSRIASKVNDEKQNFQPIYRINQKKVPKETFFAYRSLSPNMNRNQESNSSLNQNSAQFILSKNQNYCGKQIKKLAQEGILDQEIVQQYEMEKQSIIEIDKKVLHSVQNSDLSKKANQTAPNFFKNESNGITENVKQYFSRKKSDKILPRQKPIGGERSSSLSPPKNSPNKRFLPHRVIQTGENIDRNYLKIIQGGQIPVSHEKNKQWKEIERQTSPAQLIEEKYMKSMKMIEKAYERHDLNPRKKDVQFNNQYFTIIRYTGQTKTPIDIVDSEYIDCKMYALAYNSYFIPSSKRSLPYYIEVDLHSGEIEFYLSKTENPNLDHNDFIFFKFDIPIKINYQRGEVKDGVYLNIFCRQQSSFSFRVLSETGAGNIISTNIALAANLANKNEQNQQSERSKSPKNNLTQEYKKQLIKDKASYNEQRLKNVKKVDAYVVDTEREKQKKLDFFLESRQKGSDVRNIIEDNIKQVRKYSPKERKDLLEKMKNDKEVKIIRALYNKNLQKFQEINKEILVIQRKAERKEQLIDADGRLESEVRLLKQCFQYRWLQVFVLIQIVKVFSAQIKAYKVKLSRNVNLTSPIMNLNGLLSGYLKKKLGGDKMQRTYTRVYFCLKTRVKAFKKLMVYNASLVAGEFMMQKIKLMIIQSKMMIYYNHIVMIQRSYRKLLKVRDQMNVVNLAHWDVALKIMLEDETKFFDKSWIAKPILVDYKKRLEKNKMKVLSHYVKMVQSQFFSKLKQYQAKLKKLPYAYQIAYSFCGKAFNSFFEKQYTKLVTESFNLSVKRTNEYYIETLKFMVKHNIYQLVNNPITAYEKEKQKQLESQRKKNIEALRLKELQLQKQREEEFMQQKFAKSTKKITVQQPQEDQSGSSASSIDSNGEVKKVIFESGQHSKKNKSQRDSARGKLAVKKPTVIEAAPISFQDYVQEEEKKIEELRARRVSKIVIENEQISPTKLMEQRLKKKIGIKNVFNSSMNSINMDESIIDEQENTPRSRQDESRFSSKKNSVLFTEVDQQLSQLRIPSMHFKKREFSDEVNSPRQSNFKKDKSPHKLLKKDGYNGSMILNEKKAKMQQSKRAPKKSMKTSGDNDENYFNDNNNNNENEEEEDYEYEENENYHEDIDNYLMKHHTPIKRSNKKQSTIKKSHTIQKGDDNLEQLRTSKSPHHNDDQKSRRDENEENDDMGSHRKIAFELTGQKQSQKKKKDAKQSIFKHSIKNTNSSSESSQSMTSIQQLSQSNLSIPSNINHNGGPIPLNKDTSIQSSLTTQSNIQDSNIQKESSPTTTIIGGLAASAASGNRTTKKNKKKKSKKKKIEIKEEGKLEEIVEGDEATQTFWSNFIHYPIFMSYPNLIEMKELIIKLLKKL